MRTGLPALPLDQLPSLRTPRDTSRGRRVKRTPQWYEFGSLYPARADGIGAVEGGRWQGGRRGDRRMPGGCAAIALRRGCGVRGECPLPRRHMSRAAHWLARRATAVLAPQECAALGTPLPHRRAAGGGPVRSLASRCATGANPVRAIPRESGAPRAQAYRTGWR